MLFRSFLAGYGSHNSITFHAHDGSKLKKAIRKSTERGQVKARFKRGRKSKRPAPSMPKIDF